MSRLNATDRAWLKRFRVTAKVEKASQIRRITDEEARTLFDIGAKGDFSGVGFPGNDLRGEGREPFCLRRDNPDEAGKNKYMTRPGSEDRYLYCLPGANKLNDAPVVLVESPKSVLAIASAAERCGRKVLVAATNGCWGWKQKTDDEQSEPLADLDLLAGRDVIVCLDSNVATKRQVARAEKALAAHLVCRVKARSVRCARVPLEDRVNGPDDYLASHKDDRGFWKLIDAAREPWQLGGMFATYEELMKAPEPSFLIRGLLQDQGITFIHGASGHGKTLLIMSVMKALLSGDPLFSFKEFKVEQKASRILYLSPEVQLGQVRLRLKLFGLLDYVKSGQLLVRSLTEGPSPDLLDPDIQMAARDSVVVLDTAVRFMKGKESASEDNRDGLAAKCFALLGAGAKVVLGAHHSPKNFSAADFMSLENMSRGSGDLGGMLSGAWGVAQVEKEQNTIHIENLKPRDQDPFRPFQVVGRPHINEKGDFRISKPPGVCEAYGKERPQKERAGRKPAEGTDAKLAFINEQTTANPQITNKQLAGLVNEKFGSKHTPNNVGKWRLKPIKGQVTNAKK